MDNEIKKENERPKKRGRKRYVLITYVFFGLFMLLLAIFPRLLDRFARLVGIYSSVNALFAVTLFFASFLTSVTLI